MALIIPCFVLGFLGGRLYTPISKMFRKFLNSITLQNVTAGYVIWDVCSGIKDNVEQGVYVPLLR